MVHPSCACGHSNQLCIRTYAAISSAKAQSIIPSAQEHVRLCDGGSCYNQGPILIGFVAYAPPAMTAQQWQLYQLMDLLHAGPCMLSSEAFRLSLTVSAACWLSPLHPVGCPAPVAGAAAHWQPPLHCTQSAGREHMGLVILMGLLAGTARLHECMLTHAYVHRDTICKRMAST